VEKYGMDFALSTAFERFFWVFSVGHASLPAGSGGILPPVKQSGQDARRTGSQGWLPYKRAENAKQIRFL